MRRWDKGVKAFFAIYVIVPAVVILLVSLLDMPPAVEAALIALSVSPMLPTLPNDLAKMGCENRYSISLEVVGALMALIAAPVVFWIVSLIIQTHLDIKIAALLISLAKGIFLPLGLGILFNLLLPKAAVLIAEPVIKVISLVLLLCVLIILWNTRHIIAAELDWRILLSILVFVFAGLAAGHFLGGPEQGDRAALALTAASRHIGFALAIGVAVAPRAVAAVAATVLIYFIARGLIVLPYQKQMKK